MLRVKLRLAEAESNTMKTIKTIAKWILGLGCILAAYIAFSEKGSIVGGLLFLTSAMFLIPPTFERITEDMEVHPVSKILMPIIFFMLGVLLSDGAFSSTEDAALEEVEIDERDPLGIGVDSVKNLVGKKIPYNKFKVWGEPTTLDVTSNKYWAVYLDVANISFVSEKKTDIILFAEFEKQGAIDYMSKIQKERKELIESHLDPWDGSHVALTKLIKAAMNDPSGYEHEETIYWDMGDHVIVKTTYIEAGIGRQWVKVKADIKTGEVLKIIEGGY